MGNPSTARFSLRHPDDADRENKARRQQREEKRARAKASAETKLAHAAEDRRRTIAPAKTSSPRASAPFYSDQARAIAATEDATERDRQLNALGLFGLPIRAEVELLRLRDRTLSVASSKQPTPEEAPEGGAPS